jgi:hypothetical protein
MLRIDWSTCVSDSGATLTDLSALGIVSILVAVGNQNPAAAPLFSRDPRALFWSLPSIDPLEFRNSAWSNRISSK